jgi:hypothetical protein
VFLVPGVDGDLQFVLSGGQVMIDVQAAQHDVDGHERQSHSTIRLLPDAIVQMRDLLNHVIGASAPPDGVLLAAEEQGLSAVWGESIYTERVIRRRKRRVRA